MLIIVRGLPGTGKSTVANLLSQLIDKSVVLRTDEVRKKLISKPTYTHEEKSLVYKVTLIIAEYLARLGYNIILDGTFFKKEYIELAKKSAKKVIVVECQCKDETAISRLSRGERFSSDALKPEIFYKVKKEYENYPADIEVNTDKNPSEILTVLKSKLEIFIG